MPSVARTCGLLLYVIDPCRNSNRWDTGEKDVCGSAAKESHHGRPEASSWPLCLVFLSLWGLIVPIGANDTGCGVGKGTVVGPSRAVPQG